MQLIDTHSHLYHKDFQEDIDNVIKTAIAEGVTKILLPNIDTESIEPMMQLAGNYPDICVPMMGLHPTSIKENFREELNTTEQWLQKENFCAIGEIGIDLYWDKTFLKEQVIAFEQQLHWALRLDLPVIIHARDAFNEIFASLDKPAFKNIRGIFHSFCGTMEDAKRISQYGNFLFGINGIVTFKNAKLPEVVKYIGLDNLVIETDAPYLAPTPKRGKRNEPLYTKYIAQKLAEIFDTDPETVAKITTRNAKTLLAV